MSSVSRILYFPPNILCEIVFRNSYYPYMSIFPYDPSYLYENTFRKAIHNILVVNNDNSDNVNIGKF